MFQHIASKENGLTAVGRYILCDTPFVVDHQLPAIGCFPVFIQVADHRELTTGIVAKLIFMPAVESTIIISA